MVESKRPAYSAGLCFERYKRPHAAFEQGVHRAFKKQNRWNRFLYGTGPISSRCRRGQCKHLRRCSMVNRFMISVAAAALIAGAGFANAQGTGGREGASSGAGVQQSA